MKSADIRSKFLAFFNSLQHKTVESSSLIPQNDPTLLFANAGMNQFKDFFTGKRTPEYKKAVSVQKCVRAGGKHNDLENVGFTARHQTFFEMLGNFSFGDYFKEGAIEMAWEFLTKELKIPTDKLWITVFEDDDEAEEIWMNKIGIPKNKIYRMGKKDNFWEMGEYGPCGPCSEIFYDHGEKYATGATDPNNPITDEGRFVEIWNLVFMQFEKTPEGTHDLPNPCVDTGAGLERVAAAMQGVYWNYDTDLFQPIIKEIEKLSGHQYGEELSNSMRVIADHIRASVMLITDGVMPDADGRGYVLRRIIRRAVRHLQELGIEKTSLYKLIPQVFEILGSTYKENQNNLKLAQDVLTQEEDRFRKTLKQGLKILQTFMDENASKKLLPGSMAFKLYDTYGFPLDLTEVILQEKDWKIDHDGFEKEMHEQVERSKKAGRFQVQEDDFVPFYHVFERYGASKFLGYETLVTKAKLLAKIKLPNAWGLVFDQTPFYGESGGQIGDRGIIKGDQVKVKVVDTIKPVEGYFIHIVEDATTLNEKNSYELNVDSKLRNRTAHNHSATHLLQSALINILGSHVKQAGSLVTENKLRFDFTHSKKITTNEIIQIEDHVNKAIQNSLGIDVDFMSKDQAIEKGAMALFGEKYGDSVRVITMGDESIELCGGTHVKNTNEIGIFKILSEASLSTGVRRIEALTGIDAYEYLRTRSNIFEQVEQEVSLKNADVLPAIVQLKKELKNKNKTISELEDKIQQGKSKNLFEDPINLGSHNLYLLDQKVDKKQMKKTSDFFMDQYPEEVLLILNTDGDKLNFLARINKKSPISLKSFAQEIFKTIDGRGGGKEDMIQGSFAKQDKGKFLTAFKTLFN